MLYLLTPDGGMGWSDLPGRAVIDAGRERGIDLTGLEWLPADRRAESDTLRLALRYGVACSVGIVVDGVAIAAEGHAEEIRQGQRVAERVQASIPEGINELMDRLFEGWKQHGRELDERGVQSSDRAAQEAEAELADDLAAPVDQALVEHWSALGGRLPDPL